MKHKVSDDTEGTSTLRLRILYEEPGPLGRRVRLFLPDGTELPNVRGFAVAREPGGINRISIEFFDIEVVDATESTALQHP